MNFWDQCSENGVATLNCLPLFLENILKVATAFAGAVAVFFVAMGGYKFIRSGGDPKQVEGARQTITYAIIGLILVFMSYFIIVFIATLTGVDCIKKFGFNQCRTDSLAEPLESVSAHTSPVNGDFGCFKSVADPSSATDSSFDASNPPQCQGFVEGGNTPAEPIGGTYYSSSDDCIRSSVCEQ